jgi:hypothetical protein
MPGEIEYLTPKILLGRLRGNLLDPTLLAIVPVGGVFCLFRWLHLIALQPYWLYLTVLIGAGFLGAVYTALWEDSRRPWHRSAYIGSTMLGIAIVAYMTGWGRFCPSDSCSGRPRRSKPTGPGRRSRVSCGRPLSLPLVSWPSSFTSHPPSSENLSSKEWPDLVSWVLSSSFSYSEGQPQSEKRWKQSCADLSGGCPHSSPVPAIL